MEDLEIYLKPTKFFDFDKKSVKEIALKATEGLNTDKEKAIALFYWVRDQLRYNMYSYLPKYHSNLKASTTLRRRNGFCMSKAVTLSTLARAVGIPARIHMVDIINHKIPQWVVDLMGTEAFHCHAYSELYLNGKWVRMTPVFDHKTSIKAGFLPEIEFDGENDELFSHEDLEGNLFVEYIEDRGVYADVPIDEIEQIFQEKYGNFYSDYNFQAPKKKSISEK